MDCNPLILKVKYVTHSLQITYGLLIDSISLAAGWFITNQLAVRIDF